MIRFVYPGGIVLLSMAANHWVQTPNFDAIQGTLNEHTAALTTLSEKMDGLSQMTDRMIGSQELSVLRQESLERAHRIFEQRMAEMQNVRVEG